MILSVRGAYLVQAITVLPPIYRLSTLKRLKVISIAGIYIKFNLFPITKKNF